MIIKVYLSFTFSMIYVVLFSQQNLLPLSIKNTNTEQKIYSFSVKNNTHTSTKPYNTYNLPQDIISSITDSSFNNFLDNNQRRFLNNDKKLFIAPVFETSSGAQSDYFFYNLSIGGLIQYSFSPKVSLNLSYRYVESQLKPYLDTSIFVRNTIPSTGVSNSVNASFTSARNTNDLQGYLAYTPNRFFSFLLGRGNHFWGDGYRSLFLSDNASPYPYFRINSSFWNIQYTNLYSWHQDISSGQNIDKFSASHHLSWNIIPEFNIGIFETVIWSGKDTLMNRNFDPNYLNPAIFYRPVEYAQGSNDNSLMGLDFKLNLDNHILYGQLLLDEFLLAEIRNGRNWWGNKYATQIGYKNYNFLNLQQLFFLIERNVARPFTYSHITNTLNYGHLNQALAHPLGANFKETIIIFNYQLNPKWNIKFQSNFIAYGAETSDSTSIGNDIFRSYALRTQDFDHTILQGEKHRIFYNKIELSKTLSNAINLQFFTSIIWRKEITPYKSTANTFIQLGLSTNLWNRYEDF